MGLSAPPTAIVSWSDVMAINIVELLKIMDIRVPEDISLVGYDDIDFLPLLNVPLTTISIPKYQMGIKAAEILLDRIENARKGPPEKILLKSNLIVRNSTAPPGRKIKIMK